MSIDACLSSDRMDWATPTHIVKMAEDIMRITHFDIDVAADETNHKAPEWYDKNIDALNEPWIGNCWCNPPYGRELPKWVEKAASESKAGRASVAMLIPARTDTRYFHEHIWDANECVPRIGVEVHFLKGRIKFIGAESGAPFPSMIVIFKANEK